MTSRPKHVSSLSDKIAGLKFMQRAKAVQNQHQQPGPSSVASSGAREVPVVEKEAIRVDLEEPEDFNDEHWSLPALKQSASSSSLISHEPGWNAWLIEAEDMQTLSESATATAPGLSSRRSFGTWVRKPKKKQSGSSTSNKDEAPNSEDGESFKDSGDEEGEASDEDVETKGFIKPGSVQSKSDTSSKREHKSIGKGFKGGEKIRDKRKDNEKGKKRPSKDGLSGFPDNSTSQKKKKSKTQ